MGKIQLFSHPDLFEPDSRFFAAPVSGIYRIQKLWFMFPKIRQSP